MLFRHSDNRPHVVVEILCGGGAGMVLGGMLGSAADILSFAHDFTVFLKGLKSRRGSWREWFESITQIRNYQL